MFNEDSLRILNLKMRSSLATSSDKFWLNKSSKILSPSTPGATLLQKCVSSGVSIHASQSGANPITSRKEDEQWLYCETSGTSGDPKIIRRRPRSWIASFQVNQKLFQISEADIYGIVGYLGNSLALYAALEAFHVGADICALSALRPTAQLTRLFDDRATVLYATPTQIKLLAIAAGKHAFALNSVRLVLVGGGKFDDSTRLALRLLCPYAEVFEFFGASETSFVSLSNANTPSSSVGLPYPNVQLRIGNNGTIPALHTGEIWVSSPYLFDSYAGGSLTGAEWDGPFLSIGEMGFVDKEGYLYLRGRKNRMFTVSDRNVFPEEIESIISKVSGVNICAVISKPDALRGNVPVCFVQADPAIETFLRFTCKQRLDPGAVPKSFHFLDSLPLLAAGKPDLQALQRML